MKLLACCFLLAAVAVKIEAVSLPDSFITGRWRDVPPWPNSFVVKYNRINDKMWKPVWERIKRQLVLNMKKIAEEYATKKGASTEQLKVFMVLNYEMFRYHWRTIAKGIQYYVSQQKKILSPAEMEAFCDKYTMMFARCLKLERFYHYGLRNMPVPILDEDLSKVQRILELTVLPPISQTGNKWMSYPMNT